MPESAGSDGGRGLRDRPQAEDRRREARDLAHDDVVGGEAAQQTQRVHREDGDQDDGEREWPRSVRGCGRNLTAFETFAQPPPPAAAAPLPVRSDSTISASTAFPGRTRSSGSVASGSSTMRISSSNGTSFGST